MSWSGKALLSCLRRLAPGIFFCCELILSPPGDMEIRPGAFRWTKHDANCEARATLLRPVLELLIEYIAITGRGTARTAKHERPCLGQRKEQLLDQAHRPLVNYRQSAKQKHLIFRSSIAAKLSQLDLSNIIKMFRKLSERWN